MKTSKYSLELRTLFWMLLLGYAAQTIAQTVPSWSLAATSSIPLLSPSDSANTDQLTTAQVQALWRAGQHTRGANGFVYRSAVYNSEEEARRVAYAARRGRPFGVREFSVTDLLPVSKSIRPILADLWNDGAVSEPRQVALASGSKAWAVVQLIRRTPAQPRPNAPFWAEEAQRLLKAGLLPSLTEAQTDVNERSRQAFWFARSAAEIAAVGPDLSPNVQFGSFSTPLTQAIISGRPDLVDALIARGANPNQCGIWGCPLHAAISNSKSEAEATVVVERLIAAGAKPNQFDKSWSGADRTALGESVNRKYLALADRLMKVGAHVDGVPNVGATPLISSLTLGGRTDAQWLIDRGASVLHFADDRNKYVFGQRTLYSMFVGEYGDEIKESQADAQWARKLMTDAASRSKEYAFRAWIEQDGVRVTLSNAGVIRLKPAPFKLEIGYPEAPSTLMFAASLDDAWAEQVRRKDLRLPVFSPGYGGATAATGQTEPPTLYLSAACNNSAKEERCEGSFQYLTQFSDGQSTFHTRRSFDGVHVRNVNSLSRYDSAKKADDVLQLSELAGKSLYLLVASPLVLHVVSAQELINPLAVKIEFNRP